MGETWEYFGSAFVNSCLQGHRDYSIESAHERFLFTILIYELRCLKTKTKKKRRNEFFRSMARVSGNRSSNFHWCFDFIHIEIFILTIGSHLISKQILLQTPLNPRDIQSLLTTTYFYYLLFVYTLVCWQRDYFKNRDKDNNVFSQSDSLLIGCIFGMN